MPEPQSMRTEQKAPEEWIHAQIYPAAFLGLGKRLYALDPAR